MRTESPNHGSDPSYPLPGAPAGGFSLQLNINMLIIGSSAVTEVTVLVSFSASSMNDLPSISMAVSQKLASYLFERFN